LTDSPADTAAAPGAPIDTSAEEGPTAYGKAVELLARRAHFRAELGRKLGKKGFSEDEVEAALDRLTDQGYLDDRAVAKSFVEAKTAREPMGRRRLMADLTKKGAPSDVAAEVLDELLPRDDRDLARAAAQSWHRRKRRPKKAALARYLERRGFTPGSIWNVLDDFEWPEES